MSMGSPAFREVLDDICNVVVTFIGVLVAVAAFVAGVRVVVMLLVTEDAAVGTGVVLVTAVALAAVVAKVVECVSAYDA